MIKITHVLQHLSLGGATRALLATAKFSTNIGNYSHQIISLLPADQKAERLANEYGVKVVKNQNQKNLKRILESTDIVHVSWWNNPELQDFLRSDLPSTRLLLWFHVAGNSPPQVITEDLINFADFAVACSPYTYQRQVFRELPPKTKLQKTDMVYGAADFDRLANIKPQDHEDFNVGYIGTVDFIKMHPNYITMNAAVEIPDVKFLICGGGQEQILRKQAKNLGAEDRFQFLGYVDDIKSVIEILDVFGYPLCEDTYAAAELTLQEVMYAGIPPVVFPHGGVKNLVINDFTGIVVHSKMEYKQAIEHLYHHPDERRRLGENAKAYAEQIFGAKNAASKMNTIYEKMLEKPKVDRVWGKIAGERILDQPITIDDLTHRGEKKAGSDIFIESLGNHAQNFINSKYSKDPTAALSSDEIVANSSRLLRSKGAGGIQHYRNYYDNDPYLNLWAGLVLQKHGNHLEAVQKFSKTLQLGLEQWRVFWYLAKSAHIINNEQLTRQSLEVVLHHQPNFSPARDLLTTINKQQPEKFQQNDQDENECNKTNGTSEKQHRITDRPHAFTKVKSQNKEEKFSRSNQKQNNFSEVVTLSSKKEHDHPLDQSQFTFNENTYQKNKEKEAEALLQKILDSENPLATLTKHEADLDNYILTVLEETIQVAAAEGKEQLVNALNTMSNYISEIIEYQNQMIDSTTLKPPVLIYQMGKVGSSSIRDTLKKYFPGKIIHSHNYQDMSESEQEFFIHQKRIQKTIKIITPVRDPISRNISSFFQNFHRDTGHNFNEKNWTQQQLKKLFLDHYPHNICLEWFDYQFRPVFDINVYNYDFPKKQKYSVLQKGIFDILILRTDLDRKGQLEIISDFLDCKINKWVHTNISAEKEYGTKYKHFTKHVKLPKIYLTLLTNSRFCRHFWTDDEISSMIHRWEE